MWTTRVTKQRHVCLPRYWMFVLKRPDSMVLVTTWRFIWKNGSDSLCILRPRRCVYLQIKSKLRVHQNIGQKVRQRDKVIDESNLFE
jgi:hypothetical protein